MQLKSIFVDTTKKKPYCSQNGDCTMCSLVNYGKDCYNIPLNTKNRIVWNGLFAHELASDESGNLLRGLK